jgi:hypothetical protein
VRVLGPSGLAVHLPPVLAVLATTALLAWIGGRAAGAAGGLAAGAAFACSVGTYLFTRETLPDGLLIACVCLAMAAALAFRIGRLGAGAASVAFGAALAGGVLSKGLLGLAFPIATVGLVRIVDPEPRRIGPRHAILALGTFLAIAAPWHVAAALRNPGFFGHVVVNEQVLRFLGRREPADVVSTPLPVFWALFLVWLLPWTAFLPAGVIESFAALRGRDARGAVSRLALAWTVTVVGFFSVSARLEHYAFAAMPPLALLVGLALVSRAASARTSRAVRGGFVATAVMGAVLGAAALTAGFAAVHRGAGELGAGGVRSDRAYESDFGPLADLPADLRRELLPLAAVTLGALGAGALLAWRLEAGGRRAAAVAALCAGACVFGVMADHSLRDCEDVISSRRFGLALARVARPGDRFFVLGDFESANSIACYAPQRIELVDGGSAALAYGLARSPAPPLSVSAAELGAAWRGAGRVFLLANKDRLASLGLPHPTVVAESDDRALVGN